MIIVAMLLFGPVSGRFCRTTRQALTVLLLTFALVVTAQTIIVANTSSDGLPLAYWLVQLAALAGALLLLWLGITFRPPNQHTP